MLTILTWVLALLFWISSQAMEGNSDFWRSSIAAKNGPVVVGETMTRVEQAAAKIPEGTQIFYGRFEGGAQRATQIFIRDRGVLVTAP